MINTRKIIFSFPQHKSKTYNCRPLLSVYGHHIIHLDVPFGGLNLGNVTVLQLLRKIHFWNFFLFPGQNSKTSTYMTHVALYILHILGVDVPFGGLNGTNL